MKEENERFSITVHLSGLHASGSEENKFTSALIVTFPSKIQVTLNSLNNADFLQRRSNPKSLKEGSVEINDYFELRSFSHNFNMRCPFVFEIAHSSPGNSILPEVLLPPAVIKTSERYEVARLKETMSEIKCSF